MKRGEQVGMSDGLKASVVIASYNRKDDVCECLGALPLELLDANDAEVIVVDDGSTDGTVEAIGSAYPWVRVLVNVQNSGPAFSRNRGSREARGQLLVYLDSDAVPERSWLGEMVAHDDGRTVLLGCIKDYGSERVQGGPRRATFIGKSVRCGPERANTGASCNLGIPRACFDAIGGFDEEIPYYFEDSDLCIRAGKAGYGAQYVATAVVRHKGTEVKQGKAVWQQEHNSTYAMLKAYRGKPFRTALFTVLNCSWALWRVAVLGGKLNRNDGRRILSGCLSAYARFYTGKTRRTAF